MMQILIKRKQKSFQIDLQIKTIIEFEKNMVIIKESIHQDVTTEKFVLKKKKKGLSFPKLICMVIDSKGNKASCLSLDLWQAMQDLKFKHAYHNIILQRQINNYH